MAETAETQLLSVSDAAKRCAVSKPHMYRLIAAGVVPAIRIGAGSGPIRIDARELERWIYATEDTAA